jgi:hypothetical protein
MIKKEYKKEYKKHKSEIMKKSKKRKKILTIGFLMLSFLLVKKSNKGLYSALSIRLKENSFVSPFAPPVFKVTARSKFLIRLAAPVVSYRLNSILSISSNFKIRVGLLINTKAFARGYKVPSFARREQRTADALRAETKPLDTKTWGVRGCGDEEGE